jgi:hypothetical protein
MKAKTFRVTYAKEVERRTMEIRTVEVKALTEAEAMSIVNVHGIGTAIKAELVGEQNA